MGVEPTSVAWEATVLPMNYTRAMHYLITASSRASPDDPPFLSVHTRSPEAFPRYRDGPARKRGYFALVISFFMRA